MSSDLQPYNFTLSDNSPIFQYLPFRDGPIQSSWNVTFSGSPDSTWAPDTYLGQGTSSHRTSLVGASVQLQWVGTAVFLYGNATSGSYTTSIDSESSVTGVVGDSGILASYSGLSYGDHTIVLNVVQDSLIFFNGATITVGMGLSGTSVQVHNVSAVTTSVPPAENAAFFNTAGEDWDLTTTYGSIPISWPRIDTYTNGAAMSFSLNSTLAFTVDGSINYNHGPFSVVVTPSGGGAPLTNMYNGSARWVVLDEIQYLQTGMDPNQTYNVEITNESDGWFDFCKVVIYGTPSSNSTSSSPSPSQSAGTNGTKDHSSNLNLIIGVAVGGALLIIVLLLLLGCLRSWRRRQSYQRAPQAASYVIDEPSPMFIEPYLSPNRQEVPLTPWKAGPTSNPNHYSYTDGSDYFQPAGPMMAHGNPSWVTQSNTMATSPSYGLGNGSGSLIQEEDAGPVHIQTVPPRYNNAWSEGQTESDSTGPRK